MQPIAKTSHPTLYNTVSPLQKYLPLHPIAEHHHILCKIPKIDGKQGVLSLVFRCQKEKGPAKKFAPPPIFTGWSTLHAVTHLGQIYMLPTGRGHRCTYQWLVPSCLKKGLEQSEGMTRSEAMGLWSDLTLSSRHEHNCVPLYKIRPLITYRYWKWDQYDFIKGD